MKTTVYENQYHDIFIVNEFHKDYYVCTYVKVDRVEPEAVVVYSEANMNAMIQSYRDNGFTDTRNPGKKVTPKFGMAIQYFNEDDYEKIKSLFQDIAHSYSYKLLVNSSFKQVNVDTGHNWFEIDSDGDIFMTLNEKFLSPNSMRVKLEDMED